ncbi:MAG: glutaminyl-peptide cyclotransferase [Planctomycetota bacterium]|nr:MAG: glutaminyl-peptide cyclotransferase [Planctomycetota bacterium]
MAKRNKKRPQAGAAVVAAPAPSAVPAGKAAAKSKAGLAMFGVGFAGLLALAAYFFIFQDKDLPIHKVEVVRRLPHDSEAYTQGLLFHDGFLYESTGKYGRSSVRKVEVDTGKVVQQYKLNPQLFGEGLALWQNKLIQLTWKAGKALVYDLKEMKPAGEFEYEGDGWGLTCDGKHLIFSNGTDRLVFYDPETFKEVRRIKVQNQDKGLLDLNELEYVRGEIWANVWKSDFIARINPKNGQVLGWLDCSRVHPNRRKDVIDNVLNGIAWDQKQDRIYVTGKLWPYLFEIKIAKQY